MPPELMDQLFAGAQNLQGPVLNPQEPQPSAMMPWGPGFDREWGAFLEQRKRLTDQILDRVGLTQQIRQRAPGTGISAAFAAANQHIDREVQQGAYNVGFARGDLNELIGAARFYNIPDPEKIPPDVLKEMIRSKRYGLQDARRGEGPEDAWDAAFDTLRLGAGALGIGIVDQLIDVSQRVPFIGDALAKNTQVQYADQRLAQFEESFRGELYGETPDGWIDTVRATLQGNEAAGWKLATGLGGLVGYALPAHTAWLAAGRAGALGGALNVGTRLNAVSRAAIRGGAAEWMLEGGGDAPLEQRALYIGLGAAGGALFDEVLPQLFRRFKNSIRRPTDRLREDWAPIGDEPVVEGDWEWADDSFGGYGPGAPPGTPQLGPGPRPIGPAAGAPELPAGQYEMPAGPAGPYDLWNQTPPEIRGMVRRMAQDRRAARRAAETDPLTGAGNRAAWERARGAAENDPGWMVVALDVNNLKAANDLVSHGFGDEMISRTSQVAGQVAGELGIPNRIFRTGGDEFIALVPTNRATDYLSQMTRAYGEHDAAGFKVSISGGLGRNLGEADELLRQTKMNRGAGAFRQMDVAAAHDEGVAMTKHITLMESPALPDFSTQPKVDDFDVAKAAIASRPGGVAIVRDVGDIGKFIQQSLRAQVEGGIGPQDFRIVEREVIRTDLIQPVPDIMPAGMVPDMPGMTLTGILPELSPEGFTPDMLADAAGLSLEEFMPIYENLLAEQRRAGMRMGADYVEPPKRGVKAFRTRTDILVSGGKPITNKMVKEYKEFGMFTGQRAVVDGVEVEIRKPAGFSGMVEVATEGGTVSHVKWNQLQPGRGGADVIEAPELYAKLRDYANEYMETEARKADLLGVEPSLPNMSLDWVKNTAGQYEMPDLGWRIVKNDALRGKNKWVFASDKHGQDLFPTLKAAKAAARDLFESQTRPAQNRFSWLSDETASQLPRLIEEFLSDQGIEGLQREAIKNYFNRQRILDYKWAAPEEALTADAIRTEAAREVTKAAAEGRVLEPLESAAEAKGLSIIPQRGGVTTIVDDLSGERLTVDDRDAATEFVAEFNRELPDITPLSAVPAELFEGVPGGVHPGSSANYTEPAISRGDAVDADEARIDSGEVGPVEIDDTPEPAPPAAGGGGGGQLPPPPRNLPPGAAPEPGGPALPPGQYNMGAGTPRSARFGQQQAGRRSNDALAFLNDLRRATENTSRWLPMRNYFMQLQENLNQIGLTENRAYDYYSDIVHARSAMHNELHPWVEEVGDILARFPHKHVRDGTLMEVMEMPTQSPLEIADRYRRMQKLGYGQEQVQAVLELRQFLDRARESARADGFQVGYVFDYLPRIRSRLLNGLDPYAGEGINPGSDPFFEYSRTGSLDLREKNVGNMLTHWLRAWQWAKHVAPPFEAFQQAWDNPHVAPVLRNIAKDWLQSVRFGHSQEYEVMVQGMRGTLNNLGIPVTDSDMIKLYGSAVTNMYRSFLGWNPAVIARDSMMMFYTASRVGFKETGEAMLDFLRNPQARRAMWERAITDGTLEVNAPRLSITGMFDDQLPGSGMATLGTDRFNARWLMQSREQLANVTDSLYDVAPNFMRRGIQGTWADPLKGYASMNEIMRVVAAEAGRRKAGRAVALYRPGEAGSATLQQVMKESGAMAWPRVIQQRFAEQLMEGRLDEAVETVAREVANTHLRYGMLEQAPLIQKAGMKGRFGMMLGTFSHQMASQMGEVLNPRHGVDRDEQIKFLLRMGGFAGGLAAASAVTGWNLWKFFPPVGVLFTGGPPLHLLANAFNSITGTIETARGGFLTPQQRAATSQIERQFDEGAVVPRAAAAVASSFVPWMGGVRTAQGIGQSFNQPSVGAAGESLTEFLITGRRPERQYQEGFAGWQEQQGQAASDQQVARIQQMLSGPRGAPPAYAPTAGSTYAPAPANTAVAQFGVSDPSRIYNHPQSGAPVVDTPNRTADGRVPTHRLDVPSGRRQDETWEQYETRVLSTPPEAFPPEVQNVDQSLQSLDTDVAQRVQAMVVAAMQEGVMLNINETYRPIQRQEWLFQQGRSRGGSPVTWTLTSNHSDRRAVDFGASADGYRWIQQNAERFGLNVLGDYDPGHVFAAKPTQGYARGSGAIQ